MHKKIETKEAPAAIGPYSQAISTGSLIFVSGQLPLDPKTGELIQGDIKQLTRRVLDNIEAILKEAGSDLSHVVRVDIFLTDLKRDFADMNDEYGKRFDKSVPPARQTVEVQSLPKGSVMEISCIATY